jgi:hypothetical protein
VTLGPKVGVKRIEAGRVVLDQAGAFAPHLDALRIGPVDERVLEADTVVLGTRLRPADALYERLSERDQVRLVGDAVEPRTVYEAFAEGSAQPARSTVSRSSRRCPRSRGARLAGRSGPGREDAAPEPPAEPVEGVLQQAAARRTPAAQ